MKTIKEIKKGKFTLEHKVFTDELGIKRDFFKFIKKTKGGQSIMFPFIPIIKAINKNQSVKDLTSTYTENEYKEMFNNQLTRDRQFGKEFREALMI